MKNPILESLSVTISGIDGVSNEALLAILIDRLLTRQKSRDASRCNMQALECCYSAVKYLEISSHVGPQREWVNVWDRFTCSKCGKPTVYTFDSPAGTASYPQADGTKLCCECGRAEYETANAMALA